MCIMCMLKEVIEMEEKRREQMRPAHLNDILEQTGKELDEAAKIVAHAMQRRWAVFVTTQETADGLEDFVAHNAAQDFFERVMHLTTKPDGAVLH